MTVRDVFKSNAPPTAYSEFQIQRSQRHGLNSGAVFDTADSGYSPVSRWLAKAFTYDDFVSNPSGAVGHVVQVQVPRGTIMLQCLVRVDTLFAGGAPTDVDVGTGGTPGAAPGDAWGDGLDFSSTGVKYDPNADNNPGGSVGFGYYEDGDTIDVYWQNATAPTAGQAILFMKLISYHEDLNEEW